MMLSSSDAKLEIARKLGAKYGINCKAHPDWEKEVLKAVSPSHACFIDPDSQIASTFPPTLPYNLIYLLTRIFYVL